jgi:hypothetical protein
LLVTTTTLELAQEFCENEKAEFIEDYDGDPSDEDYIHQLRHNFKILIKTQTNKTRQHYVGFCIEPVRVIGLPTSGYVLK